MKVILVDIPFGWFCSDKKDDILEICKYWEEGGSFDDCNHWARCNKLGIDCDNATYNCCKMCEEKLPMIIEKQR